MFERLIEFVTNHYALVGAFIAVLIYFLLNEAKRSGPNLTCAALTSKLNSDEAVVLDVRQLKDFSAGHIVDSIHIPLDKVKERIAELEKYKDKLIVVVCASGITAGSACTDLQKAGFSTARLQGGIGGWRGQNLPTVKK